MSAIKSSGNRKISSVPDNANRLTKHKFSGLCKKREDLIKLVKHIDESLIGKNATFTGPYGRRKVIYCDYEASGRSLQFVEDYIVKEVLPHCGSISSTANILSLQSILFRHEAKEIIRICVNASNGDSVIFTGLGCGGPIAALLRVLKFNWHKPPVVFVGACEHKSTISAWKEIGAKVVRISESKEGFLDLNDLESQLIAHKGVSCQLIGCFSAANKVTGILADDMATTLLLHQYGALAFWDYSTAAPHVQLDMNPTLPGVEERAVRKDVIFFSCHKFLGGMQTPGVLVVKKFLFENSGSAYSVTYDGIDNQDLDIQGDRGSVTIVEDVRAGVVFHLKEAIGSPAIASREDKVTRSVLSHVKNIPEFVLLGSNSQSSKRLPFFSFVVRHPRGMFLHHNFVCTILNDVFGIQAQGCSADAGCRSVDFMGIDLKLSAEYDGILSGINYRVSGDAVGGRSNYEILRPGFTRISLPFCISDAELGFILEALKMVATEGWKLLPQYTLKPGTGEWRHHSNSIFRDRKWLSSLKYTDGRLVVPERKISNQGTCPVDFEECLHVARCIFNKARKIAQRYPLAAQKFSFEPDVEPLRWFMLPSEAHNLLVGNFQEVRHKIPFDPTKYKGCHGDSVKARRKHTVSDGEVSNLDCRESSGIRDHSAPKYCNGSPTENHPTEMPNSDFLDAGVIYNRGHACHTPNGMPSASTSHSSTATSSLDAICYSPQPALTTPAFSHPYQSYQGNVCGFETDSQSQKVRSDGSTDGSFAGYQCGGARSRLGNFNSIDVPHVTKLDQQHSSLNKVHFLLGRNDTYTRQRCNSLGSTLVFHSRHRGNSGHSCRSLTDGEASLNLSECSLSSNEDIHAYVTEVTKELATEIKSEIREVISKVEDVLSDSMDAEANHGHGPELKASKCFELKCEKLERTNSLTSASATDIAQYLVGVSKEMAEEMKSEIRGLVNSVVSSDTSPMVDKGGKKVGKERNVKESKNERDGGNNGQVTQSSTESISQSQDSGINLSYAEAGGESRAREAGVSLGKNEKPGDSVWPARKRNDSRNHFQELDRASRCRSESLDSLQENDDSDAAAAETQVSRRKISRACKKVEKCSLENCLPGESSNDDEASAVEEASKPKWIFAPKAVWKPALEALKEFEMIRNGDKILICLSEGKNALAVLHALHQYRSHPTMKGIQFELGVAFSTACQNSNCETLALYLESLGIPCHFEDVVESGGGPGEATFDCSSCCKLKKERVFALAKKKNYNVVAMSQNLDDLAENFLVSVFHNGRVGTLKAHCYISNEHLRIIRPFVYVREKALRQYVENKNMPAVFENCSCKTLTKERQSSKQLLSHQESMFPKIFSSLKSALQPLITGGNGLEGQIAGNVSDSDKTGLM